MLHNVTLRRSLAATAALVAASWGAALPALADDTHVHSHANGTEHGNKHDDKHGDKHGDKHENADQNTDQNADQGSKHENKHEGNGSKGSHGDPAGNNGTVKIAPLGEMDGIPNNTPHPGCTFQIEWYGYDEGADIVSQVGFAMQAPTKDVGLTVDGPASVFVGGDPASGAGTDSGLDGVETYTLSFDGEPHPKQGFHVKLTVATPRSNGNDTKTKVFWVAPCDDETGDTGNTGNTGGTGGTTGGTDTGDDTGTGTETGTETAGNGSAGDEDIQVLGAQASTGPNASSDAAAVRAAGTQVPTSVDAGETGPRTLAEWMRSPLPLVGVAFGLALIAFAARRRMASTRA